MKKNIVSFLGILAMALVFGLAVVGCESDDDNGSNSNSNSGNNSGNNNNDSSGNGNNNSGNNNNDSNNNGSGNNSGDSNSGGGVPSELIGTWYYEDVSFEITSSKIIVKGEEEDGTPVTQEADISVSGGTVTAKQGGQTIGTFKYSISGGKMTISNGTGEFKDSETFTLTKK